MNRKVVLPLVFVLVAMLFSGVQSCLAQGTVGVSVGQTTDYSYALSGTERDSNGSLTNSLPYTVDYLETITIQQVSGSNVTFEYVRDLLNGTTESGVSWVDVTNGTGTGFLVVVPANLNPGDLLYPNWVNENGTTEGGPRINQTVLLNYGDSTVEAVHFDYSYLYGEELCTEDYYWEKSTGMLLKYSISGAEDVNGLKQTLNLYFQKVGLEQVFYPLIDSDAYPVTVSSESTILGFEYDQAEKNLVLNITGKTGTSGSCKVVVPVSLLWGGFSLRMDDYALVEGQDYTLTNDGTNFIFELDYIHSSHTIEIEATETIPEFSAFMLVQLFIASTLIAVIVYRRRLH